ncbi:MAG: hypothetical protein ABIQ31_15605 [Ferruginibacter sp.]
MTSYLFKQQTIFSTNNLSNIEKYASKESATEIDNDIRGYYYWPYAPEKLKLLYTLLIDNDFILDNQNFCESFRYFDIPVGKGSIWKKSRTALFVLLYKILDNRIYRNEKMGVVANKLFPKKGVKVESDKNGFDIVYKRICNKESDYLEKKHSNVLRLVKKLHLR